MLQIVLKLIGLIFVLSGIVLVYDARILTNKWFGFGDINDASTGLKILGFAVCIVGAILIYFNK